ncbi:MAG: HD domain-containing phosphohydrolase [Planctomycetota bacterium]
MPVLSVDELVTRLEQLNDIGVALSKEKDLARLLEQIVQAAKALTHADAGTLYRVTDDGLCRFEIVRTDSLGLAYGGTSGQAIPFAPIPLRHRDGAPNDTMVVVHAALSGRTVNIEDAYVDERFDFSGTRAFDARTGYRSKSFMTVPMKNHEGQIIGVLQLINAEDPDTGEVVRFADADQRLAESLASQAAIALTNRILIEQLEDLFESFIELINVAIDEKSPYTGGHCQRVPVLTMMLADAATHAAQGPLAGVRLSDKQLQELKLASLMHDCGKLTTPVNIVDKATKLQKICDRIELVATRFAVLKRDAEIAALQAKSELAHSAPGDVAGLAAIDAELRSRHAELDSDLAFLRQCNLGGETMAEAQIERVERIAAQVFVDAAGSAVPVLDADEVQNLSVQRGTLTQADRQCINNHAAMTHKMLAALPWPRHLRNVPAIAGSHHERLDGKGYPRGLRGSALSTQARILAIADVFEALTAKDRPYKPGKPLSESLRILGSMVVEGAIDPQLFDVFVRAKVYLDYAQRFLDPAQVDTVDENALPGYQP